MFLCDGDGKWYQPNLQVQEEACKASAHRQTLLLISKFTINSHQPKPGNIVQVAILEKSQASFFLVWYGLVQIYSPGTQKNWESFKNHHHQRSRPPMKPKNLFVVDESPALRSGTAVTTLRLRDRMNLKKAFVDTSQHLLMF